MFDLGIILTICALGGLDMVYEESLEKLCDFSNKCCLIHGIWDIDTSEATFDQTLLTTLVSLKRLTERISSEAVEFICLCMQQRFTESEMMKLVVVNGRLLDGEDKEGDS